MIISIKGMVCNHCVEAVQAAFVNAGFPEARISLGEASIDTATQLSAKQFEKLDAELHARGFERITDAETQIIEKVKRAIISHVRNENCRFNLSACLADNLAIDYSAVSKLFSAHEGRTIEKYAIAQRVEYVKELLSYRQLNISEIADKAGYSSVAHLSRQFKSITGLTPSAYMKNAPARIPLNEV